MNQPIFGDTDAMIPDDEPRRAIGLADGDLDWLLVPELARVREQADGHLREAGRIPPPDDGRLRVERDRARRPRELLGEARDRVPDDRREVDLLALDVKAPSRDPGHAEE